MNVFIMISNRHYFCTTPVLVRLEKFCFIIILRYVHGETAGMSDFHIDFLWPKLLAVYIGYVVLYSERGA